MGGVANGWQNFLLAFSALFSIVNPISSALIFARVTADRSHAERVELARRVGVYAAAVMLIALWGGAYVLDFFGISIAALRIAGGFVVAAQAWTMLSAAEYHEERKEGQAAAAAGAPDVAFFPLTMPFTTGPGTMSVAIALGSSLPVGSPRMLPFVLGSSAAAHRGGDAGLDHLLLGRPHPRLARDRPGRGSFRASRLSCCSASALRSPSGA